MTQENDSRDFRQSRPPLGRRVSSYFVRHFQVFFGSLGRVYRTPMSTFMTMAVIGIALALPGGLKLFLDNVRDLSGDWRGAARVSVFLTENETVATARELAGRIEGKPLVARAEVISPDEAMSEFRELSGFGEALDVLENNPLPPLVVAHLDAGTGETERAETLVAELKTDPAVDLVQLDTQWLKRLNALLELAHRGLLVVAGLFAVAVIVITGNTIRLEIQNRRPEIEVTKLIGATDAFVRRPFLYTGLWYGIGGGALAWGLVLGSLELLQGPVSRLAGLYGSQFMLAAPSLAEGAGLVAGGALLGWSGSWLAATRHLGEIEPT